MEAEIQKLTRWALGLFIAQSALGPWILFHAPASGIALNVYIAIGLASLFLALISDKLSQDTSRQRFEQQIATSTEAAELSKTFLGHARTLLYQALFLVIRVACWPAFEFGLHTLRLAPRFGLLRTKFTKIAGIMLFPYETSLSFFLLLLSAGVTAYAVLSHPPFVFSVEFLWLLVITLFLKHLSYLISVNTVQQTLRCGQDSPWLSYFFIAGCDFLSLLLCYHGIIDWNAGTRFTAPAIISIAKRLFAFKDFLAVFEHPPQHLIDYWIGASGLLWWLTLAQSLLHFKDYQRTPADYLSIARCYTLLSMDDRARAMLDRTEVADKQSYELKGAIYAALGEFDKAAINVQRYLKQAEGVPESPNYTFIEMFWGIAALRSTPDMLCHYIDYGREHELSDVLLSDFALSTPAIGIDARPIARFLEQRKLVERFQLSYACLMWLSDEERDVLELFDRTEPKESGARRAVWLCLAALLWPARRRSDAQTQAFLDQWSRESVDEIRRIAVVLGDEIEKCVLIDVLNNTWVFWKQMDEDLKIPQLIAAIAASVRDDEVVRKIRQGQGEVPRPGASVGEPRAAAAVLPGS